MDAQRQANNDIVAACFAHIALLRRELQWISDNSEEMETKLRVHRILARSLRMPPHDPE